jgi:hypothetical protein
MKHATLKIPQTLGIIRKLESGKSVWFWLQQYRI